MKLLSELENIRYGVLENDTANLSQAWFPGAIYSPLQGVFFGREARFCLHRINDRDHADGSSSIVPHELAYLR